MVIEFANPLFLMFSLTLHTHTQTCKSTGIKESVPLKLWYLHFQSLVKATTLLYGQLLDSE